MVTASGKVGKSRRSVLPLPTSVACYQLLLSVGWSWSWHTGNQPTIPDCYLADLHLQTVGWESSSDICLYAASNLSQIKLPNDTSDCPLWPPTLMIIFDVICPSFWQRKFELYPGCPWLNIASFSHISRQPQLQDLRFLQVSFLFYSYLYCRGPPFSFIFMPLQLERLKYTRRVTEFLWYFFGHFYFAICTAGNPFQKISVDLQVFYFRFPNVSLRLPGNFFFLPSKMIDIIAWQSCTTAN